MRISASRETAPRLWLTSESPTGSPRVQEQGREIPIRKSRRKVRTRCTMQPTHTMSGVEILDMLRMAKGAIIVLAPYSILLSH